MCTWTDKHCAQKKNSTQFLVRFFSRYSKISRKNAKKTQKSERKIEGEPLDNALFAHPPARPKQRPNPKPEQGGGLVEELLLLLGGAAAEVGGAAVGVVGVRGGGREGGGGAAATAGGSGGGGVGATLTAPRAAGLSPRMGGATRTVKNTTQNKHKIKNNNIYRIAKNNNNKNFVNPI